MARRGLELGRAGRRAGRGRGRRGAGRRCLSAASLASPHTAYSYDGEGERYRTLLIEDSNLPEASQTRTTTDYLYDGLKLVSLQITERTGSGTLLGAWQLFYLYDAQGRPYAGIDRRLDTSSGTTHSFYLFTNDRGDVLQLQDAEHVAFAACRYDAYGRPTETVVEL